MELETKSKLFVQQLIVDGRLTLAVSYVSEMENSDNPFSIRRTAIQDFFQYAAVNVGESAEILMVANELKRAKLKTKDALHLASAIVAKSDYFLTTDDRILKHDDNRIVILNPIDFVIRWEAIHHE
ncbi:MAG: PIN domain-containing protein [Oscillospiraceae bacterium]|nr:PIN domain-containing protein [Oscillospiraceae bacterium]